MFYEYQLTVNANSVSSEGVTLEMPLSYGKLTQIEVTFPPGCCGLVDVVIERFTHQILPTNISYKMKADDHSIKFDTEINIYDKPYMLVLRAWNNDTLFNHTITCRMIVNEEQSIIVVNSNQLKLNLMGL